MQQEDVKSGSIIKNRDGHTGNHPAGLLAVIPNQMMQGYYGGSGQYWDWISIARQKRHRDKDVKVHLDATQSLLNHDC